MARIFVVEDDEAINRLLCMSLESAGYQVESERDGLLARERVQGGERFDLVLLDVMLPGLDGFALLETFRRREIPVIFLTARNQVEDRVRGLREGAEDYIVKPFALEELLARVEKVLSRQGHTPQTVTVGDVLFHVEERYVEKGGKVVRLTPLELDLLWALIKHRNVALSRETLLEKVWDTSFLGESRTVDTHIYKIRQKTGLPIVCIPKVGYRLEVPETQEGEEERR